HDDVRIGGWRRPFAKRLEGAVDRPRAVLGDNEPHHRILAPALPAGMHVKEHRAWVDDRLVALVPGSVLSCRVLLHVGGDVRTTCPPEYASDVRVVERNGREGERPTG